MKVGKIMGELFRLGNIASVVSIRFYRRNIIIKILVSNLWYSVVLAFRY